MYPPIADALFVQECLPMLNCLLYALMHAWVYCLSSSYAFSICSFVPFSQVCSNVPKDMHGALPIKSSVWCSCCMCSNLSMSSLVPWSQKCPSSCFAVMSMMRLESMLSLVNLFANVDADAPNNTSAIFANGSNFSASQFTCCCRICHLRSCP